MSQLPHTLKTRTPGRGSNLVKGKNHGKCVQTCSSCNLSPCLLTSVKSLFRHHNHGGPKIRARSVLLQCIITMLLGAMSQAHLKNRECYGQTNHWIKAQLNAPKSCPQQTQSTPSFLLTSLKVSTEVLALQKKNTHRNVFPARSGGHLGLVHTNGPTWPVKAGQVASCYY